MSHATHPWVYGARVSGNVKNPLGISHRFSPAPYNRPAKITGANGKKDLNWARNVVYGVENSLIYAEGDMDVVRECNWTNQKRNEKSDDIRVRVRVSAG